MSSVTIQVLFLFFFTTGFSYFLLSNNPVIELDGNIVSDGGVSDWENIVGTNSGHLPHLVVKSGMLNSSDFVFSSPGHHDSQNIESWAWDKQHRDHKLYSAYLAAFSDDGEFDVFWAIERQPTSGADTWVGIWLLQDRVLPTGGSHGHFTGSHIDDDILIVIKVSDHSETEVLRWRGDKLSSVYKNTNNCDDHESSPLACSIINHASISASHWSESSRTHAKTIRTHNFIEGGISLHHALPDVDSLPTFHSVVIEQKDDGHTTTINRDFIAGRIQTSGLQFSASCTIDGCDHVGFSNVSLLNTGSQTLYQVEVHDAEGRLVAQWPSVLSGQTVTITEYSDTRHYNASASTYPEGTPRNIEVSTGDLMEYDCSSSLPGVSLSTSCACQTVTGNASFYYSYGLTIYNSGNARLYDYHAYVPDCTTSANNEGSDELCPGSTAYYWGSKISHDYAFTGFGGTFSAKYGDGEEYEEAIPSVDCDMSYCQITPAITVTTSCNVDYSGLQQITASVCNRGNIAVNVTGVDDQGYIYEPTNAVIQPEACTTIQSTPYTWSIQAQDGSLHVTGFSVMGSIPVDGYQSFHCWMG